MSITGLMTIVPIIQFTWSVRSTNPNRQQLLQLLAARQLRMTTATACAAVMCMYLTRITSKPLPDNQPHYRPPTHQRMKTNLSPYTDPCSSSSHRRPTYPPTSWPSTTSFTCSTSALTHSFCSSRAAWPQFRSLKATLMET